MSNYLNGVIIGKHKRKTLEDSSSNDYFFLLRDKIPAEILSRYSISDVGDFRKNYASEKAHYLAFWNVPDPLPQYTSEDLVHHPIEVTFRMHSSVHKDLMKIENRREIRDFRNVNISDIVEKLR